MQQERYLPLKIARQIEKQKDAYTFLVNKGLLKREEISLNGYLEFLLGGDFMDPGYKGPYYEVNRFAGSAAMKNHIADMVKAGGNGVDVLTEIQDLFDIGPIVRLWAESKKVYKLDAVFFEELVKTEHLTISSDSFKYLPHRVVYIDFEECGETGLVRGAFVYTYESHKIFKEWQIAILMVTENCSIHSFYSGFKYINGSFEYITKTEPNTSLDVINRDEKGHLFIEKSSDEDKRPDIIKAIIQTLMFLSSPEPDLKEITKRTYKPYTEYRNVYSEIQAWSVGIRYGKAIKAASKEMEAASEKDTAGNGRKAPRPHIRAAHWQRYHVGKGRTEIRTNWVPPSFVLGDREIPVVIHKIEGKENAC